MCRIWHDDTSSSDSKWFVTFFLQSLCTFVSRETSFPVRPHRPAVEQLQSHSWCIWRLAAIWSVTVLMVVWVGCNVCRLMTAVTQTLPSSFHTHHTCNPVLSITSRSNTDTCTVTMKRWGVVCWTLFSAAKEAPVMTGVITFALISPSSLSWGIYTGDIKKDCSDLS